jgi:hypothetical protein
MTVRVVNIGDIHFRTASDWAADKGALVGRVVATSAEKIESTIVAVNGDLTFSGTEQQFALAKRFLDDLSDAYEAACAAPLSIVCTPGNHDCDFSGDQSARDELLANLKPKVPTKSIGDIILGPQQQYMDFVESQGYQSSVCAGRPYKSELQVETETQRLDVTLLNSSWMSSIHEQAGSLLFPNEHFVRHDEGVTRIAVLHHPPNWFKQPETMRDLLRWITANADICMSGHEHCMDANFKLNERLRGVLYYEGGVFQENPSDQSGHFQIVDIDTKAGVLDSHSYSWKVDHFAMAESSEAVNYEELTAKASRTRLNDKFVEEIDDPSIPGSSSTSPAQLKDFFVYPDAVEYDEDQAEQSNHSTRRKIPGKSLVEYLLSRKQVLLLGPERCGKTALAKQLVHHPG